MTGGVAGTPGPDWLVRSPEEDRLRPLYARVLGLRFVNPGGLLCFAFFEGSVALAALLALAELVSWWAVLALPALVAVLVKMNDLVAAAVIRSAAQVPQGERDRFRRQMQPAVGRASVPPAGPAPTGVAADPPPTPDASRLPTWNAADAILPPEGGLPRSGQSRSTSRQDPGTPPEVSYRPAGRWAHDPVNRRYG